MQNYWLKIGMRALAIFIAGTIAFYIIRSGVRSGRQRVHEIADSDAPITIPLAFIPFKVDGNQLGTLSRLQILRSSPKQVEAVNFRVKLADSIGDDRLASCILVAGDNGMNFQLKHIDANNTFYCATAADTTGKNLAPLGSIETQRGGTFVLLSAADALQNFDAELNSGDAQADSISNAYERMADSIQAAADSMSAVAEQRAESLRAEAESRADSIRRRANQQADSVRRAARAQATPKPQVKVKVKSAP